MVGKKQKAKSKKKAGTIFKSSYYIYYTRMCEKYYGESANKYIAKRGPNHDFKRRTEAV